MHIRPELESITLNGIKLIQRNQSIIYVLFPRDSLQLRSHPAFRNNSDPSLHGFWLLCGLAKCCGPDLPLGDKAEAAFSKAIFAKTNVVPQFCFQDGWHILPNATLWWYRGEYEGHFMHELRGSWHNEYLIFIFQMNFYWILKVLKYLLLLDCISRFFSPTCFDFKSSMLCQAQHGSVFHSSAFRSCVFLLPAVLLALWDTFMCRRAAPWYELT